VIGIQLSSASLLEKSAQIAATSAVVAGTEFSEELVVRRRPAPPDGGLQPRVDFLSQRHIEQRPAEFFLLVLGKCFDSRMAFFRVWFIVGTSLPGA
jgi:hypothetical protein